MATSIKSPYDNAIILEYSDGEYSLESTKTLVNTSADDRTYTVKDGDTLQAIADVFYGDSGLWHIIAMANSISNPFDENEFYQGQVLTIPTYGGN